MENHSDINLQQLRQMIIRYGAKNMSTYESDLFYDCQKVGNMQPGQTVYWMVSEMHTHTYSDKEITEKKLDIDTLWGNRCNFKITCTRIEPYDAPTESKTYFDMTRIWSDKELRDLVKQIETYN